MSMLPTRWLYTIALAPLGALTLGAAFIAFRSYRSEAYWFKPHRRPVPLEDAASLQGAREVEIPGPAGALHGWYAPSRNRAAVVLVHGTGGDRRDMLGLSVWLAEAGFGVLLFDWPGHGTSEGGVDWSGGARGSLEAALDWLQQQPDVDPAKLGALGFSLGGFTVAQVAAGDARLRAVALLGTPHDQEEHTRWEQRRFGRLSQEPALWAMEQGGLPRDERPPVSEIGRIAPRAVLVVAGAEDEAVPVSFQRRLFEAAGEPKTFLLLPGVAHGGHAESAPAGFRETLVEFFGRTLSVLL